MSRISVDVVKSIDMRAFWFIQVGPKSSDKYHYKTQRSIPMFIATLFTIARTWKQPGCPLADEWIRKLWYLYTTDYCSAIKKKKAFQTVLMKWVKLEPIIQSEVSQKEKGQYCILTHAYGI